ncbi:MAG: FecR domain-containing protein [Gemmatimonadaceae bacterium]
MATTRRPVDPQIIAAFREGDEHALEKVFYERFAGLLELARVDVPDAARASRVLVGVFLRAWQERAAMDTPGSLGAYLDRVAHDAALREKGRMASLHRFEAHEGVKTTHRAAAVPSIDDVWAEVKSALHATSPDHEQLRHDRQVISKHHAAEHMAAIGATSRIPAIALGGVVVVALAVMAAFFWIPASGIDGKMSRALANADTRVISTNAGQRGNVKLDDGTAVTLGADSKLKVPPTFPATLRVVALDGTASFSVQPGAKLPLYVRAGDVTLQATGTLFDVSSYAGDDRVTLRVREGAVLMTAGGKEQEVKAGGAAIVSDGGKISAPSPDEVASDLGWIDGQIVVNDRPIKEVIPLLRRWYQLDVTVAEKSLLDRKVTLRAGLDSANAAKQAMETNASVVFDFDGKRWVLRDLTTAK